MGRDLVYNILLREYETIMIRYIYEKGEATAPEIWEHVNGAIEKERAFSRGILLSFLHRMVDSGILQNRSVTLGEAPYNYYSLKSS